MRLSNPLVTTALLASSLLAAACAPPTPPAGELRTVLLTEGTNMAAVPSPDGTRLVLALHGILWIVPVEGGPAEPITPPELEATWPTWSPDGLRIAFQSFSDHFYQIWSVTPDGAGLEPLTEGPFDHREPAWSPEGSHLAFASDRALEGSYDIWTLDLATRTLERLTRSPAAQHAPAWSPDGSRIAWAQGPAIRAAPFPRGEPEEELARSPSGSAAAPSWSPDGTRLAWRDGARQIVVDGERLTEGEDVFPFAPGWLPDGSLLYTADGGIRVRTLAAAGARSIPFEAELTLERTRAPSKEHRFDHAEPRPVQGIFAPTFAPGADRIAFVALGDLWVMPLDAEGAPGTPERLTRGPSIEWIPSWSPSGERLYISSDLEGQGRPNLWAIDPATGAMEQITHLSDARMIFPTLSPDGERLAWIDGSNQSLRLVELATGATRTVAQQAYASNVGRPSWSPDGRYIALADIERANSSFREGRNLIRIIEVASGQARFIEPAPYPAGLSERFEAGPAWSPDGRWLAFIMASTLHLLPIEADGTPRGEARRLLDEAADLPAWAPDSRSLLYLSNGTLRQLSLTEEGEPAPSGSRSLPIDLAWQPAIGEGEQWIFAGALWDGLQPRLLRDRLIRVEGARIVEIREVTGANAEELAAEAARAGASFLDAGELTVLPGLWDAHVHPRVQDFTGQWWAVQLAWGLTTVLSNGVSTYHSQLQKEALATGNWAGPRLLTAPIFDGLRTYYGHHRSVADERALEIELEKARTLEMDYLKAYVRAPIPFMRRTAEAARAMGVPNGSHFLTPGIQVGMGGTTHLSASQRMGYSFAQSEGGRSYRDVIELYAKGDFDLSSHHTRSAVLGDEPGLLDDPRFTELMPPNYQGALRSEISSPPSEGARARARADVETPATIHEAGGLVTIGSDTPLSWPALGLHAQLRVYATRVSNHEALQAVTLQAARYAGAERDLGSIEQGKIADLVFVRGDPLDDVAHAGDVVQVMKNGVLYTVEEILAPYRR